MTILEPPCFWVGTLSGLSYELVPRRLFARVRLLSVVTADSNNTGILRFPLPSSKVANSLYEAGNDSNQWLLFDPSRRCRAITTCYVNCGPVACLQPVTVRFLSCAFIFSRRAGAPHTVPLSSLSVECSQLDRLWNIAVGKDRHG